MRCPRLAVLQDRADNVTHHTTLMCALLDTNHHAVPARVPDGGHKLVRNPLVTRRVIATKRAQRILEPKAVLPALLYCSSLWKNAKLNMLLSECS